VVRPVVCAGLCCSLSFSGLNLFFNGDGSTPGISVFGQLGATSFLPNPSSTILRPRPETWPRPFPSRPLPVAKRARSDPSACWYCHPRGPELDPDQRRAWNQDHSNGEWLRSERDGGSLWRPYRCRTVLYCDHLQYQRFLRGDRRGAATPLRSHGRVRAGLKSGKLGAATLLVTPEVAMSPEIGGPGGTVTAYSLGFGANERQLDSMR
jgi:hypothetical protein